MSPKGPMQGNPNDDLNYHTTAEDAGDGYFPQILKYTENAPQESILSRDNYSTSQHPSMISQPRAKKSVEQKAGDLSHVAPSQTSNSRVRKYFNKNKNRATDSNLSGAVPQGNPDQLAESGDQARLKNVMT